MKRKIPLLKIEIRNQNEEEAVIDIDGEIGWVSYDGEEWTWNTKQAIKKKLKEISKLNAKKIIVNISSLGGFVDEGLAIHDILAQHPAEIETRVIGMTASAATIVAQAGDIRKISDNALYLIHKSWGMAIGNENLFNQAIEDLKKMDERILSIYAKRSGKDEKTFKKLMNEYDGSGKWIDAEEAEEFGLIDEIFEPMKAVAAVGTKELIEIGLPIPESYKDKKDQTIKIDFDVDTSKLDEAIEKVERLEAKREKLINTEKRKNKFQNKRRIISQLKFLK